MSRLRNGGFNFGAHAIDSPEAHSGLTSDAGIRRASAAGESIFGEAHALNKRLKITIEFLIPILSAWLGLC
mgnify:CR=1 FL=1